MKKILILNGNPHKENKQFDEYCQTLGNRLTVMGDQAEIIMLREKSIGDCIGCYSCWLKTPGVCALKDDQTEVLRGFVHCDLVVLASPITMGFVSADIKKVHDRLIPLVHPFLQLVNDRMAHCPRYDKTAQTALLLEKNGFFDENDAEIIRKVYGGAVFTYFTDNEAEEVAYAAHNI